MFQINRIFDLRFGLFKNYRQICCKHLKQACSYLVFYRPRRLTSLCCWLIFFCSSRVLPPLRPTGRWGLWCIRWLLAMRSVLLTNLPIKPAKWWPLHPTINPTLRLPVLITHYNILAASLRKGLKKLLSVSRFPFPLPLQYFVEPIICQPCFVKRGLMPSSAGRWWGVHSFLWWLDVIHHANNGK